MRQIPWIIFKGTLKIVPTQRALLIGTMPFVALQQLFKPALRNRLFSGLSGGTDGRVIKGGQKVCRNFFLALPFDSCFCCPSVTGREVLNWRVEGWKRCSGFFGQTGICLLECGIGPLKFKCLICMSSLCLKHSWISIEPWTSPWAWYSSEQRFQPFPGGNLQQHRCIIAAFNLCLIIIFHSEEMFLHNCMLHYQNHTINVSQEYSRDYR